MSVGPRLIYISAVCGLFWFLFHLVPVVEQRAVICRNVKQESWCPTNWDVRRRGRCYPNS
jgi:hypothetical protein